MRTTVRDARGRQQGIGLVEIMIAMVLGVLVMGAMVQVYLGSKRSFNLQNSLSARQEVARFAVETLQADGQLAGFRGCLRNLGTLRSSLSDADAYPWNFARHLEGFDASGANWSPPLPDELPEDIRPGTDVLTLRTVDDPGVFLTADMLNSSAVLETTTGLPVAPFAAGDIVMVADCGGATVFQVSAYDPDTGEISHAVGGGLSPGNASANLARVYEAGAQVFRIRTTSYFIRNGANGWALWRQDGDDDPQELAAGVENMQVEYGQDLDGNRTPDIYRKASEVDRWDNVVSVRIALLVANATGVGNTPGSDSRTFDLLGVNAGPFNDERLRSVVNFTIAVRNHLP